MYMIDYLRKKEPGYLKKCIAGSIFRYYFECLTGLQGMSFGQQGELLNERIMTITLYNIRKKTKLSRDGLNPSHLPN